MIWWTERLKLVPIGTEHAGELWTLHQQPAVAAWYDGRWTVIEAMRGASSRAQAWAAVGFDKWMAYDRQSGDLVGRGGLSLAFVDGAERIEVGWVLHPDQWGHGYATEIGQAGLDYAFDRLDADEVIAFTEPHNARSRAVMERLGMYYQRTIQHAGESFVLYAINRPQPSS